MWCDDDELEPATPTPICFNTSGGSELNRSAESGSAEVAAVAGVRLFMLLNESFVCMRMKPYASVEGSRPKVGMVADDDEVEVVDMASNKATLDVRGEEDRSSFDESLGPALTIEPKIV